MSRRIRATPLVDAPIVGGNRAGAPHLNINGPSLLRVPDWVENALGRYYLYFASHKGSRIEFAIADALEGPWRVHAGGALALEDTPFLHHPPSVPPDVDRAALEKSRGRDVPSPFEDATLPHIASPDVVVDSATRTLHLYYHGLDAFRKQPTRVAVSRDGIRFEPRSEKLAWPYLRMFPYRGIWYGMSMPGTFYRSDDGLTGFERGPTLFPREMRHAGLWLRGDELWVFWTRVGDAPERILLSTLDLAGAWDEWRASDPSDVHRPTHPWEGADEPVEASVRSSIGRRVHQLRDPYVYVENEQAYLLYAVAGEAGLAIARLEVDA